MSVSSALAGGRRAALLLLTGKCTVTRPGPISDELDDQGMPVVSEPAVIIAEARCWLDMSARRVSSSASDHVAGDYVKVQRPSVSLDLAQPLLKVADIITITESTAAVNVGRTFTVAGLPAGDFAFLADYSVEEVI